MNKVLITFFFLFEFALISSNTNGNQNKFLSKEILIPNKMGDIYGTTMQSEMVIFPNCSSLLQISNASSDAPRTFPIRR